MQSELQSSIKVGGRLGLTFQLVLLAGILIRLVVAAYTQHAATWAKVTHLDELLLLGGNPLVRATSFGVSFYFFYIPMYQVFWLLSAFLSINYEFLMNFLFRIPPIVGDIIATFALYEIGFRVSKERKKALILASVYFLNPYVIWVTALVGHAENLMMAFVLLSMVYLLDSKVSRSAFILAFATGFRHIPLLILPFFLYYARAKKLGAMRYFGIYLLASSTLAIPYAISILQLYWDSPANLPPFFDHWLGTGSAVQGTGHYGIDVVKGFPYNFTGIIASVGLWGVLGGFFGFRNYLIAYALLTIFLMRKGFPEIRWLTGCVVATFSLLLIFTPLVQHHYLMWAFPFILLVAYVIGGIPKHIPHILVVSSMLIDPIIEGSFYYAIIGTFPLPATQLQGSWFLRDAMMQLGLSAVHGLSLLFVVAFLLIGIYRAK